MAVDYRKKIEDEIVGLEQMKTNTEMQLNGLVNQLFVLRRVLEVGDGKKGKGQMKKV